MNSHFWHESQLAGLPKNFPEEGGETGNEELAISTVPRLFTPPVFDRLQFAKMEGEGLGLLSRDPRHSLQHRF